MPGANDLWPWLQSIIGNQGAANPIDPNAIPAAAPQAMPGSGLNGMPAMTQGGPSMGYPAMGQPGPQPTPQPQPGPPWFQFGGFHPENILQGHPPGSASLGPVFNASGSPGGPGPGPGGPGSAGDDSGFNNPFQAAAKTYPHMPWPGSPSPQTYPHMPWPDTGAPAGSPSDTPKPAGGTKGPLASSGGGGGGAPMKRTPGAPNLGYYQPSNRFIGIDRPNADPQNSMRAGPQGTALNLAGLFGGRGQPAAAPANVPAANATPVSSSAAPTGSQPSILSGSPNAPDMTGITFDENGDPIISDYGDLQNWGYGPLQRGNIWRGSGGPSGRLNR